jgi:hypothetical protein
MIKAFLFLSGILLTTPALSNPLGASSLGGINAISTNQALNNQSAIGTVNQSPIGGVNSNYQINNSQATDYGFAPGIYCRGANFGIGAYGSGASSNAYNYGTSANDFGLIALLNIPISGNVSESCKALAREIVKQRQLDTSYNMIKVCSSIKKEKISLDYNIFPEFKICDGVSVSSSTPIPRDTPFTPKPEATVTVPVR